MSIKYFHALCMIVCILFSKPFHASGQLDINYEVPDILIRNIINHDKKELSLSDFKNKLVILDFWASWCSPCVAAFPKLDSLQKQFRDEIMIIPVTYENAEIVKRFFSHLFRARGISLMTATSDTILKKYFPHASIPHYVWIYNGRVRAITETQELTAANIRKVIDNASARLKRKLYSESKLLNKWGPIFEINTLYEFKGLPLREPALREQLEFYSVLTKGRMNVGGGASHQDSLRLTFLNTPIINLYKGAFSKFKQDLVIGRNWVLLELEDSSFVTPPDSLRAGSEYIEWQKQGNGYCYELVVPPELSEQRWEIMQQDLNRYFGAMYGIEGVIEKRNMNCLVLIKTGPDSLLLTKGGNSEVQHNAYYLKLQNTYIDWLFDKLRWNYQHVRMPLVDETGLGANKVDMEIRTNLGKIEDLNLALNRYGLKFIVVQRIRDMLIIRKKS